MKGGVLVLIILVIMVFGIILLARTGIFSDFGKGITDALKDAYRPQVFSPKATSTLIDDRDRDLKIEPAREQPKEPPPEPRSPTSTISTSSIPRGFTRGELSLYFNKVRINSVSRGRSSPGSYSQINISVSLSRDETVNITRWEIQGNKDSMKIPQAVEIYNPFGNQEKDIVVKNGDYLRIYSTQSPVGKNFKLNKCTGYLETVFGFTPSLPKSCPRYEQDAIASFAGECQDYIRSLRTCEMAQNSHRAMVRYDECRSYLADFNYSGCYKNHKDDSDFLKREWRVWADKGFLRLDSRHDRLLLYDREGLLVDEYVY